MPATLLMMAGKPKILERRTLERTLAQRRTSGANKANVGQAGTILERHHRQLEEILRPSKAGKRRIEEEDRERLDKAMRASRESSAPKRKNDNEDF